MKKHPGLSSKKTEYSKWRSIMAKLQNQLDRERKDAQKDNAGKDGNADAA